MSIDETLRYNPDASAHVLGEELKVGESIGITKPLKKGIQIDAAEASRISWMVDNVHRLHHTTDHGVPLGAYSGKIIVAGPVTSMAVVNQLETLLGNGAKAVSEASKKNTNPVFDGDTVFLNSVKVQKIEEDKGHQGFDLVTLDVTAGIHPADEGRLTDPKTGARSEFLPCMALTRTYRVPHQKEMALEHDDTHKMLALQEQFAKGEAIAKLHLPTYEDLQKVGYDDPASRMNVAESFQEGEVLKHNGKVTPGHIEITDHVLQVARETYWRLGGRDVRQLEGDVVPGSFIEHLVFGLSVPEVSLAAVSNRGQADSQLLGDVHLGELVAARSTVIKAEHQQDEKGKRFELGTHLTGFVVEPEGQERPIFAGDRFNPVPYRDKVTGLASQTPPAPVVAAEGVEAAGKIAEPERGRE